MTIYYSKLKALWDELNLYSSIPPCTSESNKTLEAYKLRWRSYHAVFNGSK